MNRNILMWLESSAEKYPTNIAFGDVKEEVTYTDLKNRARIIGSFLAERVKPCSPVAFYLEKSCLAMCGMLGAVYVRGFYSVLDIRQPHARTEKTLEVLKPAVILTDHINFQNALTFSENAPIFSH